MASSAAFRKESRMKFANATKLYRKSGVAEWRICGFFSHLKPLHPNHRRCLLQAIAYLAVHPPSMRCRAGMKSGEFRAEIACQGADLFHLAPSSDRHTGQNCAFTSGLFMTAAFHLRFKRAGLRAFTVIPSPASPAPGLRVRPSSAALAEE